jgi:hypothetical protein
MNTFMSISRDNDYTSFMTTASYPTRACCAMGDFVCIVGHEVLK